MSPRSIKSLKTLPDYPTPEHALSRDITIVTPDDSPWLTQHSCYHGVNMLVDDHDDGCQKLRTPVFNGIKRTSIRQSCTQQHNDSSRCANLTHLAVGTAWSVFTPELVSKTSSWYDNTRHDIMIKLTKPDDKWKYHYSLWYTLKHI